MDSTAYSVLVARLWFACILWAAFVFLTSGAFFYALFSLLKRRGLWFFKEREEEKWWDFLRDPVISPLLCALSAALLVLLFSSYCYSAIGPSCSEQNTCSVKIKDTSSQELVKITFDYKKGVVVLIRNKDHAKEVLSKEVAPDLWRKRASLNNKTASVEKHGFLLENGEIEKVYIITIEGWQYVFFVTSLPK
jgi:hypothetical protein